MNESGVGDCRDEREAALSGLPPGLKERYRAGRVGDVEIKRKLVVALEAFLEPIRQRRAELERRPLLVEELLAAGSKRAHEEASRTLEMMKEAMGIRFPL